MSAAAMHQSPVIPPRPARTTDKDHSVSDAPLIPPRPTGRRSDRSVSPNPDRFALSPLSGGVIPANNAALGIGSPLAHADVVNDPFDRAGSVPMPSVGEEGLEYSAVADELQHNQHRPSTPEQTRTVSQDLQLHAPKPSLPASSAKKQVMTVTRTDSDKAASFGIGKPNAVDERATSRDGVKKRPSSCCLSLHSDQEYNTDDEHGIPEIGQRVPMIPHLGDVQAPSPGPGSEGSRKHHNRKHSARGLPPGSYGLHCHGVVPQDKLDKAYYQKHPEVREWEQNAPLHDRQTDFAMTSSELNKLVRDTPHRRAALSSVEFRGTPTDEVAFQASEEYTSRIASMKPASASSKVAAPAASSKVETSHAQPSSEADKPIHVDDAPHPEFFSYGDEENVIRKDDPDYIAPILAPDEVKKDPSSHLLHPAIHPLHDHRRASFEAEDPPGRILVRPVIVRSSHSASEFGSTPLEDVDEYEPLFTEDTNEEKSGLEGAAEECESRHQFPSKDVWEDAPSSVLHTAEVSAPQGPEVKVENKRTSASEEEMSITPAQAFAQYQEQLAEQEAEGSANSFLPLVENNISWIGQQLSPTKAGKVSVGSRFPSRDVWEDAPESQLHQAIISQDTSPTEETMSKAQGRSTLKSAADESPSGTHPPPQRQGLGGESSKPRPPVSDKPKPPIPPRPAKSSSGDSRDGTFSKPPKPPVPSRPVGSKIAALQAGFMSDLNRRLQLGPKPILKKEEPVEDDAAATEKEKDAVPLSDARKGRARGPPRRAPARAGASSPIAAKPSAPGLVLSQPQTLWAVDPDFGDVMVESADGATTAVNAMAASAQPRPLAGMEKSEAQKIGLLEEPMVEEPRPMAGRDESPVPDEEQRSTSKKTPLQTEADKSPGAQVKEEEKLAAKMRGEGPVVEATLPKEGRVDGADVATAEVRDEVDS